MVDFMASQRSSTARGQVKLGGGLDHLLHISFAFI